MYFQIDNFWRILTKIHDKKTSDFQVFKREVWPKLTNKPLAHY